MTDIFSETVAELDSRIAQLERLIVLAKENDFLDLARALSQDLADTRPWKGILLVAIHQPAGGSA